MEGNGDRESKREKPSEFGRLLLERRVTKGLTQEDLAGTAGISVRALRNLERGSARAAQRQSAQALAGALGLTGEQRAEFLRAAVTSRRRTARPVADRVLGNPAYPPPALVPDFVGRREDLDRIESWHRAAASTDSGLAVAIVGPAGVGKTTLAVAVAHLLADEFPDGCLSIDLRGMDDQPVPPGVALDSMLRSLGVATGQVPRDVAEQADLLRLALRGRRVSVLLDNVANEAQVRPLLAAVPGCLTVITCRRALSGLEAVRWLWLSPLPTEDAVTLLAAIADPERVRAEPAAVRELVRLCGNLPLAVRIAGNRLARQPQWSIGSLAAELRDEHTRLTALAAGDLRVRPALVLSYQRLSIPARRLFRRLVLVPGADFGLELAAVAADVSQSDARGQLEELVDATMVQTAARPGRYQFHDLVRIFARERLESEEAVAARCRAGEGVHDYLLATAARFGRLFDPYTEARPRDNDRELAADWLAAEASNWLAAARHAATADKHQQLIDLGLAMHWYSEAYQYHPWAELFGDGVAAARAIGDRHSEAVLLNFVGWAKGLYAPDQQARIPTHAAALAIAREIGDRHEEAWALAYMGSVLARMDRLDEALDHNARATELFVAEGYWPALNTTRNVQGRILRRLGRYDEALAAHRMVLSDLRRRVDQMAPNLLRYQYAFTSSLIGEVLLNLREWARAAEIFHDVRMSINARELPRLAGESAFNEGIARRGSGQFAAGAACLRVALDHFTDVTARWWRARTMTELATTLREAGELDEARDRLREALDLCAELDPDQGKELARKLAAFPDPA